MSKKRSDQKIKRLKLDQKLRTVLGNDNVYFEPPASIKINYPCLIYSVDRLNVSRADNKAYLTQRAYQIISITTNPDTDILEDMINSFDHCFYERRYKSDNLIHDVFTIYF